MNAVRSRVRVRDTEVEHAVNLDGHIVLRDGGLLRDGDRLLLQRVHIRDSVDDGHEEVQSGVENGEEPAEAFHHERALLGDDNQALCRPPRRPGSNWAADAQAQCPPPHHVDRPAVRGRRSCDRRHGASTEVAGGQPRSRRRQRPLPRRGRRGDARYGAPGGDSARGAEHGGSELSPRPLRMVKSTAWLPRPVRTGRGGRRPRSGRGACPGPGAQGWRILSPYPLSRAEAGGALSQGGWRPAKGSGALRGNLGPRPKPPSVRARLGPPADHAPVDSRPAGYWGGGGCCALPAAFARAWSPGSGFATASRSLGTAVRCWSRAAVAAHEPR